MLVRLRRPRADLGAARRLPAAAIDAAPEAEETKPEEPVVLSSIRKQEKAASKAQRPASDDEEEEEEEEAEQGKKHVTTKATASGSSETARDPHSSKKAKVDFKPFDYEGAQSAVTKAATGVSRGVEKTSFNPYGLQSALKGTNKARSKQSMTSGNRSITFKPK